MTLTDYGYLRALRSDRAVPTAASSAGHRALISEIIAGLAAVSGASERALHAIASDSLAGRLVDAVAGGIAPDAAGRCAEELFTAPLIRPRFLDLTIGADGTAVAEKVALSAPVPTAARRVVRRCSCCLIYQVPGENRCRNCPRRTAAEKAEGWARMLADR